MIGRRMAGPGADDSQRVEALRELLPATAAGIYLDTATRGPLAAEAAEAMREAFEWDVRVGRVTPGRQDDLDQREAETRAVLAALLGATDPDAVVLTHGVDDALALGRQLLGRRAAVVEHVDPLTGQLRQPDGGLLDASLSAGALLFSVEDCGAEAVAVAGDRWLLGPEGIGGLWLRDGQLARRARSRELSRPTLLGLARSVGWLQMYVGIEWATQRTVQLARRLSSALMGQAGIVLLSPKVPSSALVVFRLAGWPPEDAADELNHRVQALTRPVPAHLAIRASVGWFNTEQELDRFAAAVAELGRHTPATLPRRPRLVVLPDR
jgi:selenocysteine lyase/cysteine desulfurase